MKRCCQNLTMIKVCGLTRQEDAFFCSSLETPLAGFIFHEGSPRCVTPQQAREIDTSSAMRVGVFVKHSVDEVLAIMDQARLHLAQLHGDQDPEFCKAVGKTRVMRVFWPQRYKRREDLEQELERFGDCSRFFLLDAGKDLGGHGATLDPEFLAGLQSPKAWFLAGGLGPDNVLDMVKVCNPCGVDLNSGVERSPGVKDHEKLTAALRALCSARS